MPFLPQLEWETSLVLATLDACAGVKAHRRPGTTAQQRPRTSLKAAPAQPGVPEVYLYVFLNGGLPSSMLAELVVPGFVVIGSNLLLWELLSLCKGMHM